MYYDNSTRYSLEKKKSTTKLNWSSYIFHRCIWNRMQLSTKSASFRQKADKLALADTKNTIN